MNAFLNTTLNIPICLNTFANTDLFKVVFFLHCSNAVSYEKAANIIYTCAGYHLVLDLTGICAGDYDILVYQNEINIYKNQIKVLQKTNV